MREASIRVLWHWKSFDLYLLKHKIQALGVEAPLTAGVVSRESIGTPEEKTNSFLGIPRISGLRRTFYEDSLDLLGRQYRQAQLPLFREERPLLEMLHQWPSESGRVHLYIPHHVGPEEHRFLCQLKHELPDHIQMVFLPANTLLAEDELPMPIEAIPETFSRFRRRVEKRPYTSYRFASCPVLSQPDLSPGRARLKYYLYDTDGIQTYKKTRNGLGEGDYSSRLSKWLAIDQIGAPEIGAEILRYESTVMKNESTYWLLFELLWRDYFHFLHRRIRQQMFSPQGMRQRRSPGLTDPIDWVFHGSDAPLRYRKGDRETIRTLWQRFRSWAMGETGTELIDAIMTELYATGESSNRARQCAASFLIHDLHVPWWWGAQWFEFLLLDYDVSSNWGNWAYIAGVGADPLPARRFNIALQTDKYDANGAYRQSVRAQGWHVPEGALPNEVPVMG